MRLLLALTALTTLIEPHGLLLLGTAVCVLGRPWWRRVLLEERA